MNALAAAQDNSAAGTGFLIAAAVVAYFVPLIIALARRLRYRTAVAVVNVLLGWTGVGWIAALVMAVWPKPRASQVLRPPHGV